MIGPAVRMEATILLLITRPAPLLPAPTKIVRGIRMRWRGATWERAEPSHRILREVIWSSTRTIARHVLLHLMCLLLGVEHHLLISPLCKLRVGSRIEVRALLRYL